MSAPRTLDNANPTVLNPTPGSYTLTASSRAFNVGSGTSRKAKLASLWEGVGLEDWEADAPELVKDSGSEEEEDEREEIDAQEVFDLIRSITDPEHPLTLEQLAVVSSAQIQVYNPPRKSSRSRKGRVSELNGPIANEDGTVLKEDGGISVDLGISAKQSTGMAGATEGTLTSKVSEVPENQQEISEEVDGGLDASILVQFTPTIPHCSMSTLIGLSLRVRLMRALPPRYKVDIRLKEGSHQSENAVNKQLNDKERVHAALENTHLLGVVEGCLASSHLRGVGNVGDDSH